MWIVCLLIGAVVGGICGLFLGSCGAMNKEDDAYMAGFAEGMKKANEEKK